MFGMNKERFSPEMITKPEYRFAHPNTLLFLTGTPFSGKSTLAPLIAAEIEGCGLQNMDILRIVAQEIEAEKPVEKRTPFVNFGSCDSYVAIGNGSYSPRSLVQGFNAYSEAVGTVLRKIVSKLEVQGVRDALFEGVQLTPAIVEQYLNRSNRLIIVTTSEAQVSANRDRRISGIDELAKKYTTEKLILIQEEILRQARILPQDKIIYVDNTRSYQFATSEIMNKLADEEVII